MKPLWSNSWDNPLGPAQDTHAQHKHGQDEHAHRPAWLVPRPRPVGSKTCGKLRMQTRSNLTHPLCLAPYEENQHEATTLPMNSASYCRLLYTGHADVPAWGGTDENENKIAGPRPTAYGETFKNCGSESTARASGVRGAPQHLFVESRSPHEGLPSPGARAQTAPC